MSLYLYFWSNLNFLTPKAPYLLHQALKLAKNGFTPFKTGILGLNWSFYGLWPIRFLIVLVKYVQKMAIHLLTLVFWALKSHFMIVSLAKF